MAGKPSRKERMSDRPFIVFVVEGETDKRAFHYLFEELIAEKVDENIQIWFQTFQKTGKKENGDVTSELETDPDNIEKIIVENALKRIGPSGRYIDEITAVVQLVDIDGAYADKEKILPYIPDDVAEAIQKVLYFDDHIEAVNVEAIIDRNIRKSRNLNKLAEMRSIKIKRKNVPYRVFCFSRNMEHALYGHDATQSEKGKLAYELSAKYGNNIDGFISYIKNHEAAFDGDYVASWESLKQDDNSLKRSTNINLLINKLLDLDVREWTLT